MSGASASAGGLSGKKLVIGLAVFVSVAAALWLTVLGRARLKQQREIERGASLPASLHRASGEMRLVPAGAFLGGTDRQAIILPSFYIDTTEVTVAQYRQYASASSAPMPADSHRAGEHDPVVMVSLHDARRYCAWAGKRLPHPLEWEKAARGAGARVFPWGNETDARRANVSDNPQNSGKLAPADSFPEGRGPYGLLHMSGNAWEWVDEVRTPGRGVEQAFARKLDPPPVAGEPWASARGGSFRQTLRESAVFTAVTLPARYLDTDLGFRCVMLPPAQ
jgi:formylglycine-generating enzyme required for sulfatase activity